jgi:Uma2 family endonuclease
MTTLLKPQSHSQPPPAKRCETVEDLLHELGDIPASRVLIHPPIGTATDADLLRNVEVEKRLCEMIDGTLVEKPVGLHEGLLEAAIIMALASFVLPRKLGLVGSASTTMRILPEIVRLPDVSFISWRQMPNGIPKEPIPSLSPDLAVEVLSAGNTKREMARKRREYFQGGTRLVWEFEPEIRQVAVFTTPDTPTILTETHTLDGGQVLPGFSVPLREIFSALDQRPPLPG